MSNKKTQYPIPLFLTLIASLIIVGNTSANWYSGAQRTIDAYGVSALISSPSTPLNLIEIDQSGVVNYVSTIETDTSGVDWIQTGWRMYHWYTLPKQYVESCIDCLGSQGIYFINDQFATQSWGTTIE